MGAIILNRGQLLNSKLCRYGANIDDMVLFNFWSLSSLSFATSGMQWQWTATDNISYVYWMKRD